MTDDDIDDFLDRNAPTLELADKFIRELPDCAKAATALQRRGLTYGEARDQVAKIVIGNLWLGARGQKPDLPGMLGRLAAGESAEDIFAEDRRV